jgi:hypothetical protein
MGLQLIFKKPVENVLTGQTALYWISGVICFPFYPDNKYGDLQLLRPLDVTLFGYDNIDRLSNCKMPILRQNVQVMHTWQEVEDDKTLTNFYPRLGTTEFLSDAEMLLLDPDTLILYNLDGTPL